MADITQVLRWQTGFVRGLAQSVLERARAIRNSLPPSSLASVDKPAPVKAKAKTGAKARVKKAVRKSTPKAAPKKRAKVKKTSGG